MLKLNDISISEYINKINDNNFEKIALEVYKLQKDNNSLYREYSDLVHSNANNLENIPFLPISFFKTHKVCLSKQSTFQQVFESSGTTNESQKSKHYIANPNIYNASILTGFQQFYGNPNSYTFLALLPSYIERGNSSLVYMVKQLMLLSSKTHNGFYLNEYDKLASVIKQLINNGEKVILIGVTFALLDFAEQYSIDMSDITVIETGGMKGRGKELTRSEVHEKLKSSWNIKTVHSEYGMTELLSQAYSFGNGLYRPTSTMKVMVRDLNSPLVNYREGVGILNIIDLANLYSCSFVETEDVGKVYPDGSFEVLGRLDHTALRGCSLMTA